jgi:hypothetical protein
MDCGICLENKKDDDFTDLPCNHRVCNECYPKIRVPVCPFCRQKYGNTNNKYYDEIDNELLDFEFDFDILYFSDDEYALSQRTHRRNRRRQFRRNHNPRQRQITNNIPTNIFYLPNINIDHIYNPESTQTTHHNTKPKRKFKNNGKRRTKTSNTWNYRNLQSNIFVSQSY